MRKMNFYEIGQRIKAKRKEQNMTQPQLAEKVHLSVGSISKYENGKVEDATTAKFNEFANALGVSPAYLMGWEDEKGNLQSQARHEMSNGFVRIHNGVIEGYNELSEENKKIIEANVQFLLNQQRGLNKEG